MTPKEMGKLHYLRNQEEGSSKTTPPSSESADQTASFENLVKRLEERMDRLEVEFKKPREPATTPTTDFSKEISSLINSLEKKIQKVSEEIRVGAIQAEQKQIKNIQEFLDHLLKLISFKGFKNFIQELWFGEDNLNLDFDEFGMDPNFVKKVKPFFDFLYYNYWRVSAKGVSNIPATGRGLIVANHSGTVPYDGSMIAAAVVNDHPSRRDVRYLVEDFVYHFPFLGTLMYRIGGVRACPENAERLLSTNHLVAVFPEGIKGIGKNYKHRYRLQRFGRGGFIKLALKTKTPIIPTAVVGAEEIHPMLMKLTILARPFGVPYIPITPTFPALGPLGLIPLPSKWSILFGEPIDFTSKYGPEDAEDQLLVNRLSEMVREKIQTMIVEELKNRRSVWFG